MHKTSIHVSLKEIRGETHSNPRKHTKNQGTKNKHEKDHEIHYGERIPATVGDCATWPVPAP
jgi:hypothetical protein